MSRRKTILCFFVINLAASAASAIELRKKFEKDQSRTSQWTVNFEGHLDVEGTKRMIGSATGVANVRLSQTVVDVDSGNIATLRNRIEEFGVRLDGEADTGDGISHLQYEIDQNGGTIITDGESKPIPADFLKDISEKTYNVKMNSLGATVGFSLDSSEMGLGEAEKVGDIADQVSEFLGKSPQLPEQSVEVGDKWESDFDVKEMSKKLSEGNPMLPPDSVIGIDNVKTIHTFREIREEDGQQIAVIESRSEFEWNDGNISLGFLKLEIKTLGVSSESIIELNNTAGYAPRSTSVTQIEIKADITTATSAGEPGTYEINGELSFESEASCY